jgi:hypothetical protein
MHLRNAPILSASSSRPGLIEGFMAGTRLDLRRFCNLRNWRSSGVRLRMMRELDVF